MAATRLAHAHSQSNDFERNSRVACALLIVNRFGSRVFCRGGSPTENERRDIVLDNFRKRDLPQTPRAQSPYSRLQEALTPVGVDAAKTEAFKPEIPRPASLAPREEPKPTRSEDATPSKLIVGPDIKLKGAEITDCDTLIVEGRVEASMDSRVIQISERGVFAGKAVIDVAEIRGCFEGELTVRKQLLICASGKVSGKIRYGKLAIEEGGEITGDIAALAEAPGKGNARPDPGRAAATTSPLPAVTRPTA
jgi:cytoskeletal protein CcmA (bactofilin family)